MELGQDKKSSQKFTPQKSSSGSYLEVGKLPPQAVDLEEAVLGAILLEKDALTSIIDVLKPETFYVETHQIIFRAIIRLFENSKAIDLLTVSQELRKSGELEKINGAGYLAELTNRVASAANIEFYARIIAEKYILRELVKISTDVTRSAYEETTDVFQLLDKTETDLFSVAEGNIRRSYSKMSDLVAKAIKRIETLQSQKEGLSGIPTGFRGLDLMTGGMQRGALIIIAARPAMGKTAFVLSLARNAAVDYNIPVAVFSLEMTALELVNRLVSAEAQIPGEKIKTGSLEPYEWTQLNTRISKLADAPLFIDDTPGLNIFELRAKARRLKQQHKVDLIIIDYLQLMTAGIDKGGNREQEISSISRALKNLAKELDIPVIALSQLNRSVETRSGTKKPQLSDLRESGAIEQDADIVMFLYRPEYYGIDESTMGKPVEGLAQILLQKHRNGSIGDIDVHFEKTYAKFTNLEETSFDSVNFDGRINPTNFITKSSKMNDIDPEITPGNMDESPF